MVSGDGVDGRRITGLLQELLGSVLVHSEVVPETVVGEVAKVDGINRTFGSRSIILPLDNRQDGFREAVQVVPGRIGGKMTVRDEDNAVFVLILGNELEIVDLDLAGGLGKKMPETWANAVQHFSLVTGRSSDEHNAVRLVGFHGIAPAGIREHYLASVGDLHSGHRFTLAGNASLHRCASIEEGNDDEQREQDESSHALVYFKTG